MVATTLSAGGLAVVHYNTDDPAGVQADTVTFALLQPIGSGTQIFFTDRAWNGSAFAAASGGEGTFTYTAGADLPAGSLITISTAQLIAAGINLADAGETLYAYQGAINAPTNFVYAADIADGNTTFNGSLVNTGLVNGTTAVAIDGDNASFADRGHNIQTPDLLQSIGNSVNWTTNDNSPQVTLSGNFFAAPDQQIWVTSSGGGAGFIRVNRDGADTTGTQQVTVYQNSTDPATQINHPNDIVFDTVHGLYFFADSDTGNRRIIQGRIADLLNPDATPVFTVLWTDQSAGTTGGQVNGLAIDVDHATGQGALYFVNKGNFNRVEYDHDGTSVTSQTADTLATLPVGSFANEIALDIQNNRAFVLSTASSTEAITVPAGTPGAQFDPDSGTWYIIGTNVTNNEIWQVGGLDRTDSSTANTTFTRLNFVGGDNAGQDLQDGLGLLQSIDIDPTSGQLYFTSLQINGGVAGETGGIYRYNLAAGTYETLYSEGNGTDYGFEYIDVDSASGRYFVSNVSFDENNGNANTSSILTHSLSAGTPTHFVTAGNINASSPQGLIVNNAPTQVSTGNAAGVTETVGLGSGTTNLVQPIATIDVTDPDTAGQVDQMAGAQVRISGNFQSGVGHADTLTINGTTSGTLEFGAQDIGYSYNAATGVMTLSGPSTFNNYEAALLLVRYSVSGDNPTNYGTANNRTISWSVSDGLNYSDETSATITVTGVNDAPVNVVPGGQAFNEDVSRTFSTANGNALSVSDVDANPATQALSVTLSVTQGTLTLSAVTGLTFSAGDGTGDTSMTFTGTANAINAALNGLVYASIADYNGSDTLTFTVNDQGFNGNDPGATGTGTSEQDSDTVALTITAVADIVDDAATIAEDAGATNILVQANDTFENAGHAITAVGTAAHGTVSINDNGTAGNAADDFVVYTADADFHGTDTFTYTVTSGGVTETATATVTVTAVADIAGDSITVDEDSGANTLDLLANDSFENAGRAITAVGAATHGTVSIDDNGTSGDATDDFVVYTPDADYNGADSFTYTVTSGGVTETATVSVTVNSVNDAPDGADKTITFLEDGSHTLTAADFGFTDAIDGNNLLAVKIVTLPGPGLLTLNGSIVNAGDFVAVADIDAGKLLFTLAADANGDDYAAFTFQVQDDGGTANSGVDLDATANTITFDVTPVNDAPAGADATLTIAEDGSHVFAEADFGFTDTADGDSLLAVTITTLPGAGTLLLDGAAVTAGDSVTAADIAAGKLVFTPAANASGSGYASFTFQVQDDGGTANSGIDLDASANTLTIDVTAANDAPVNTVPGAQSVNEDGSLTLSTANGNAISVADVDAGSLTVTLSVADGALTLANTIGLTFGVGDGAGDTTMTFSGTAAAINTALGAGVTYAPGANYNGSDSLSITTSDNGEAGAGGTLTDSDSIAITVNPLNDPPVVPNATGVSATEQTATLLLPAVTISDLDLDARNGGAGDYGGSLFVVGQPVVVATDSFDFDTTGALFTVSGTNLQVGGLTFATLDVATGALGITFTSSGATATTALVNDVIQHLTYTNTSDAPPAAVNLVYGLQDGAPGGGQGTVVGGNDLDGGTVTVTITAVNDAPVVTDLDGDNVAFTEGDAPVLINAQAPAAITDADSSDFDGGTLTISIDNVVAAEDLLGFEAGGTLTFSDGLNEGSTVSVGGTAIGAIAAGGTGAGGDDLVIALNSGADAASLTTLLQAVTYGNADPDDPTAGVRNLTITLTDGDGGSTDVATTVTVSTVDSPGIANNDLVFTTEDAGVGGNVLANDSDADTALAVGTVEGSILNVDTQITLGSGALLTVNADGTFSYDPNGAFDALAQYGSGASNVQRQDSFTYTLSDGTAATVNVVVRGVASDPHVLFDRIGDDTITGTAGVDIFRARKGGADALSGLEGNDLFFLDGVFSADDRIDGGAGNDSLFLLGDYSAGLVLGADTMTNIERIIFGPGFSYWLTLDDANVAADATLVVTALALSPTEALFFDGSAETDGTFRLVGGGCDDILVGGAGNDFLNGGANADTMVGGAGDDIYFVNNALDDVFEFADDGHDTVRARMDYTLGDDLEDLWLDAPALAGTGNALRNRIFGSFGNDTIDGLGGNDVLRGRSGVDVLNGGDGDDALYGGLGNDQLNGGLGNDRLNGEAGVDTIDGGDGNDMLYGMAGADILIGGAGDDLLYGGIQGDSLTGGTGADLFLFSDGDTNNTAGSADRIIDFDRAEGDLIHLRAMDANSQIGGNQTFAFIGTGAFSGTAGELRYHVSQGNAFVTGDTNGDGLADFYIRVDSMTQLLGTDFVL